MKKNIFFAFLFYFLILFQTSFLARFPILALLPNLAAVSVCLLSFFEKDNEMTAEIMAFIVGLMLDVFSARPLGTASIVLVLASVLIKTIIKKYVRVPIKERL